MVITSPSTRLNTFYDFVILAKDEVNLHSAFPDTVEDAPKLAAPVVKIRETSGAWGVPYIEITVCTRTAGFIMSKLDGLCFCQPKKESATLFKWVQKPTLNSNDSLTGLQANLFKIISFCLFMAVPATITSEHCSARFQGLPEKFIWLDLSSPLLYTRNVKLSLCLSN
jgi:hypothetical protein